MAWRTAWKTPTAFEEQLPTSSGCSLVCAGGVPRYVRAPMVGVLCVGDILEI